MIDIGMSSVAVAATASICVSGEPSRGRLLSSFGPVRKFSMRFIKSLVRVSFHFLAVSMMCSGSSVPHIMLVASMVSNG